ncbi:MAG TPA: mercury methylation ferredoxin HgcB [Anaerolineae bacterium]|nr:mercury methylation ferredoxin HgcB [Anaerolineae bacterium]HQI84448.1 mercury methylation ferredoxin HgcB [Anaerolineae bacterium]
MTSCSETIGANDAQVGFVALSKRNTLAFNADACINCGMCSAVCPHGVFAPGARGTRRVQIVQADACMECGACMLNCPTGALFVDSGVGCAAAMINAALRGLKEPTCGEPEPACCGAESPVCCG